MTLFTHCVAHALLANTQVPRQDQLICAVWSWTHKFGPLIAWIADLPKPIQWYPSVCFKMFWSVPIRSYIPWWIPCVPTHIPHSISHLPALLSLLPHSCPYHHMHTIALRHVCYQNKQPMALIGSNHVSAHLRPLGGRTLGWLIVIRTAVVQTMVTHPPPECSSLIAGKHHRPTQ